MAALPLPPLAPPVLDDPILASHEAPHLYRVILDLVADLESQGARREAARWRADAIAAYSRGWNEASRRRLRHMVERLSRRVARPTFRERLHLG